MRILYLFSFYKVGDGSSQGLYSQVIIDEPICDDYLVVCKKNISSEKGLKIVEEKHYSTIKQFTDKGVDLVHYFKAGNSNILQRVSLRFISKDTPILTTVCQSPSYKRYILSPFELKKSWHFVFIDKVSFNDSLISFIPKDVKSQIYLAWGRDVEETKSVYLPNNGSKIIFGRGTTLSKCPLDMFEIFDKIKVPNKLFYVVGIPETDNWVRKEAEKRNNVKVFPILPYKEWFEICKTFDVFLYQLPFNSFASIDGNLGLAMLMRKPVVYMGSEAPKERFKHAKNGFVANNANEMIKYATKLGLDFDLRTSIGNEARKSTIEDFSKDKRFENYLAVYEKIKKKKINIPFKYYIKYITCCYKDIFHSLTNYY